MITINRPTGALIASFFTLALFCTSCTPKNIIVNDDDDIINVVDDDDNTPGPADDDDTSMLATSLTGIVISAYGQPISGVTVAILNTDFETETDANGRFNLAGLSISPREIVTFRKNAYARSSVPIELRENTENNIVQRMTEVDYTFSFDAGNGYTFTDNESLQLELPPENIVDAKGNSYNGSVIAEITVFDLVSDFNFGNEVLAAPGDFTAINSKGEDKTLESFGMIQVNLTALSGEDLQLGSHASVIRLPVQVAGVPPVIGDEISAWSYNEPLGKWIEEAVGTVTEYEESLVWEFEAPHFSTWNCDRPISTHGCLTGTITDSVGVPRSGATVRAVGITYISTTTARTSQDGSFCLEVKNDETVWAEISYSIAGQTATQRTDPITISAGQASCSLGEGTCDDLGTIPVDISTCVSGVVIDSQNNPIVGAQVFSPAGGIASTDASGGFCLTTQVFQAADIFVQSLVNEIAYQPVRMYTQPGFPSCQGGCSNIAIIRPYTDTSCAHGFLVINDSPAAGISVNIYDDEFPAAPIASTMTMVNGDFCAQVPAGITATVQVGLGAELCASETLNTDNLGGEACADDGQYGECYSLSDFVCAM